MKPANLILLAAIVALAGWRADAQTYDTNNDVVQIFAGSGAVGALNAQGTLASFSSPQFVVADTASNLYVWDSGNFLIRKVTPNGTVSTFASTTQGNVSFNLYGMAIDGNNTIWMTYQGGICEVGSNGSVTFLTYSGVNQNSGICTDSGNNIYYTAGNQIYRISSQGVLTLLAGSTSSGSQDANGIYSTFSTPKTLGADQAGNI